MNYMIVSFQMAFFWSPKGIDKTIHVSWLTLALGRGLKSHHPEWPTKGFTKRREKGATGGSGWRCLELFTCTQATSRLYWFWINVYRIKILETYQLYEASRCYPYKGHRKYGNDGVHAFLCTLLPWYFPAVQSWWTGLATWIPAVSELKMAIKKCELNPIDLDFAWIPWLKSGSTLLSSLQHLELMPKYGFNSWWPHHCPWTKPPKAWLAHCGAPAVLSLLV